MSQKWILEADAKHMWHIYTDQVYLWLKVYGTDTDIAEQIIQKFGHSDQTYVVKPDQLFGKRGKYGLLGIKLDPQWVQDWISTKINKEYEIGTQKWDLHTFLIEPFLPHEQEYYIAIKTEADTDVIYFSDQWGMEIEEVRDSVQKLHIWVWDDIHDDDIHTLIWSYIFAHTPAKIAVVMFIRRLFEFFRSHGMVYLEVNPFVIIEHADQASIYDIVCLDMVAKVDDCEAWKQKKHRKDIERVKPFGAVTSEFEQDVEKMDAETGASLKFSTLNPDGTIALVLWWGWASVVVMDTLSQMWLMDEVINYWELSGNPEYRHNKHYVQGMVDMLISSKSTKTKWLCVIWGISNFTKIDVMCQAFVDALTEKVADLKSSDIHILVRRGGVNDTQWLSLISEFCKKHHIPCEVHDADVYLTGALGVLAE